MSLAEAVTAAADLLSKARLPILGGLGTDVEGMRKLIAFLTEDCCQGRPELCGEAFTMSRNVCKPDASRTRGKAKAGCK